ncbi:MAG: outer membrane lipoprotein-sorting protein [Nitrospirae bacterium]|nr:outer membrane lipoprotein-sorting protein [Nitrospirota bacterium]
MCLLALLKIILSPLSSGYLWNNASWDRLLKTAYYREYEEQLGAARPTEVIIIDGLNPQLVTTMKFSDYAYREIPDMWFQKDFLPRFTAGAGSNASD